jgi:NADPH2:quinone reductase
MRAVVYERYGSPEVLRLDEIAEPEPGEDEVLVRVRAAAVTRADCAMREANRKSGPATSALSRLVSGVRRPRNRVLGIAFAGDVEALGSSATAFSVGDAVFGSTGFRFGAFADYLVIGASALIAPKPPKLTYVEAAALPDGGLNARWCLQSVELRRGYRVLVYGASGAIGTAGVQLAKASGAEVTAVCGPNNIELVRSLGADEVIDYTRDDFTANGRRYDVIFDAAGKLSFRRCRHSLTRTGYYLATDRFENVLLNIATRLAGGQRVVFSIPPRYLKADLLFIARLVESGELRPIVDRVYPMDDVIAASRYVETERKVGNVVLGIDPAVVKTQ